MSERLTDEEYRSIDRMSDERWERLAPVLTGLVLDKWEAREVYTEMERAREAEERLQDEVGRLQSDLGAMVETEIENSGLHAEVSRLKGEVEALRGIKPELPPRPTTTGCPNCGLLIGPHDHAPGCEYA